MAKDERAKNEIIGETTDKGLPLPEKLGMVNSNWFIELIETIDELFYTKVENKKDKEELLKVFERVEQSIRDHANDYNIMTSDTFDGSQPILSEYLKKLKRYVTKIRIDLDQDVKASEVVTNKRYAGALSRDVESALDAIEQTITSTGQTINQLTSESIKHKKTTVYDELEKSDSRLFSLEAKVGSGLEASNIKTNKRYQGSSQNVESALGAIDQAVIDVASTAKQNKGDIVSLNDKVAKLQSGSEVPLTSNMINHSSKNIKATNVRDALEELFTYADDTHAKWASSVGKPLTKSMTTIEKESATKGLVSGVVNKFKSHGIEIEGLKDVPKVNLWEASFKTNLEHIYYPRRSGIYSKAYFDFVKKSNFPMMITNDLPSVPEDPVQRLFVRNDGNDGYFWFGDSDWGGANYIRNLPDDSQYPNTVMLNINRTPASSSDGGRVTLRKYTNDMVKGVFFLEKTLDDRSEYCLYNINNDGFESMIKDVYGHKLFKMSSTNVISNLTGWGDNLNKLTKKLDRPVLLLSSDRGSVSYLGMRCNAERCDLTKNGFLFNRNVGAILKRDFDFMDSMGIDRSRGVYVYVYSVEDHSNIYKKGRIDRYLLYDANEVAEHKVIRTSK